MDVPALVSRDAGQSAARLLDEISRLFFLSRAIHVAAEIGVADHLDAAPLAATELAERTGTNAVALDRLLRFLAAYGVFGLTPEGRFRHSPLSSVLRDDHPQSKRAGLRRFQPYWWAAVGELEHSIRTGGSAFEKVHGIPFFRFIAQDAEIQERFDRGMARISDADDAAIAAAYDFRKFRRIVDIGGGQGGLLARILLAAPAASGVLFDQPQVVERAARLDEHGVAERCERIGGDFFESVPAGGDCYVVKGVLHDFDDDRCVAILTNCRRAVHADGRVVIANQDVPSPLDGPHPNLTMDIQMMTLLNGRERSREAWSELFRRSGLRLLGVHPTDVLFTVIDAVPA